MKRRKLIRGLLSSVFAFAIMITGIGANTNKVIADCYNPGIETFVNSLYSDCLGRNADAIGFEDWCSQLSNGTVTGKQAAYGFFFSQEFITKANSLSDDELIDTYYRVFLNRNSDPYGKAYWKSVIAETDNDVSILFIGFSDSEEFAGKCRSYGITAGNSLIVPETDGATTSVSTNTDDQNNPEYWLNRGYVRYDIDLGAGNIQTCYAYFYDMTDHNNQVNEWRAQNGLYPLTPITDPNSSAQQYARLRAVEAAYSFDHKPPRMYTNNQCFDPLRSPDVIERNLASATADTSRPFEMLRDSFMHNAAMLDGAPPEILPLSVGNKVYNSSEELFSDYPGWSRENPIWSANAYRTIATASCTVVFVLPDGTITHESPSVEAGFSYGYGTATIQCFGYN